MFGSSAGQGRARLVATMMLAVTFAVGALAGAAGERLLAAKGKVEVDNQPSSRNQRGGRGSILLEPGVFDLLSATPEQRAEITGMIARRDSLVVQIWDEVEPRLEDVFHRSRRELRLVLDANQELKLDSLLGDRRARWRQNREVRQRCEQAAASGPNPAPSLAKPEN